MLRHAQILIADPIREHGEIGNAVIVVLGMMIIGIDVLDVELSGRVTSRQADKIWNNNSRPIFISSHKAARTS